MAIEDKSAQGVLGIGFLGLLQIAFIVLKLCKVITWSWWLVLIPLWIEIVVTALVFIIAVAAVIIKNK